MDSELCGNALLSHASADTVPDTLGPSEIELWQVVVLSWGATGSGVGLQFDGGSIHSAFLFLFGITLRTTAKVWSIVLARLCASALGHGLNSLHHSTCDSENQSLSYRTIPSV